MLGGLKPTSCSCEQCQSMCAHSTCMPTPAGAQALIAAGFGARLARYEPKGSQVHGFVGPAPAGKEGQILPTTNQGACTFFREGRCQLHGLGLKPEEGQLAHHARDWREVRKAVYLTWAPESYPRALAQLAASA